jgi:hypothetical protein
VARAAAADSPAALCPGTRWLALLLVLAAVLLLGAGEDDWLTQRCAVLTLDSPSASFKLARGCPAQDISGYFNVNYTKPGTVLDTIGINAAPAGAWNISIDAKGRLGFSIYSPDRRNSFDIGNGWHSYALPQALAAGKDYNVALDIDGGKLLLGLFEGDAQLGMIYEELPCGISSAPVYAGDFPGDEAWGAGYNIHQAFQGTLIVLYFGPRADGLTPEIVAQTWVEPGLQLVAQGGMPGGGQVLVTTEEDTRDWNGAPATDGAAAGGSSAGAGADDGVLFTLDYDLASADKGYYAQTDCLEALLTASPFYGGVAGGPGVRTQELDSLRAAKVAEVVSLAGSLRQAVAEVEPELRKLDGAYAQMLQTGLARDPSYETYVQYTLRDLAAMKAQAEAAQAQAGKLTATNGDVLADADMQYVSVAHTLMLGGLCLKQADSVCLYASLPQGEFAQSGDPQLSEAAARMEQAMAGYDALAPKLEQVAKLMAQVDCGLQQLEAADYYVGQAGLEFMGAQLPELERQLAGAQARPGVTAEQLQQARDMLRYNKLMYQVLSEQMASEPAPQLIAQAPQPRLSGVRGLLLEAAYVLGPQPAYAAAGRGRSIHDIGSSLQSIREVADLPRDPDNPTIGESIKRAFRRFSSDINQALDFGKARKAWGKTLDDASVYIHKISRVGCGWYYGNTTEEITQDIEDNYKQLADLKANGREGSMTYRNAKALMEGTEKLADDAANDFITKTFGGKLAPWAVGKLAKGLASVFTGLAKGVYTVADPSSTPGELAVGFAEIALAGTAGNAKAYEASLAGFKEMLRTATGLGTIKESLSVALGQYKEDFGKELLGTGLDGNSLLNVFLNFVGVTPAMLEEFSFDGHYVGTFDGLENGTIAFTIQGTAWQGSITGGMPIEVEGVGLDGFLDFQCILSGTYDPETGALTGNISAAGEDPDRVSGLISGHVARDVGVKAVAKGTWHDSAGWSSNNGHWTAVKQ